MRVAAVWTAAWAAVLLLCSSAAGAADVRLAEALRSGDHAALSALIGGRR